MRIALDTNVLVYAEGVNGADRQQRIHAVLTRLTADELVLPAQALAELFTVLTPQGTLARRPGPRRRPVMA